MNPLWTPHDGAMFFQVSVKHFSDRIASLPGFPDPIRVPSRRGGVGHPRWVPEEVIEWAKGLREVAA
jgi:hypothetical protein